jgi:arylsulfatase A-like enzyme
MVRRPLAVLALAALAVAGCGGRAERNLLLVTIETLRQDHVGATRGAVALTPNLVKLAERGTSFERAYAAASFTLPSIATLATGEPPTVHGVRFWTQFGNRYRGTTLAECLKSEGFSTGFVYSVYSNLTPYPPLLRGWDSTSEFLHEDADKPLAAAMAFLDRHGKERFFLWVHLFEPHTPYGPRDEFAQGIADLDDYHAAGRATWPVQKWVDQVGPKGPLLADALHAADVRAADDAVRRLLADVDRRGLTQETVVCVVSDHGENLSYDPVDRWDHGVSCDEQLVRVPMILAGPGVPQGRTEKAIARHVDLPPTLMRLVGVTPPAKWPGRDLFGPAPAPRFAVTECTRSKPGTAQADAPMYSVTDGTRSLRVFTSTAPARMELRDERDRGAARIPVDPARPSDDASPLLDAIEEAMAYMLRRAPELNSPGEGDGRLTPEQEALLKSNGYIR